jgi:hypothetical protein
VTVMMPFLRLLLRKLAKHHPLARDWFPEYPFWGSIDSPGRGDGHGRTGLDNYRTDGEARRVPSGLMDSRPNHGRCVAACI